MIRNKRCGGFFFDNDGNRVDARVESASAFNPMKFKLDQCLGLTKGAENENVPFLFDGVH